MPKKSYEWGTPGKEYPFIRQHSIAKHEILKAYLIEYFKTLTFNPGREIIKLTLIDGFAGGGAICMRIPGKSPWARLLSCWMQSKKPKPVSTQPERSL